MKIHITLNYFQTKDFCNFKKKKLKNTFLTIASLTTFILSCSAQENLPKIQTHGNFSNNELKFFLKINIHSKLNPIFNWLKER